MTILEFMPSFHGRVNAKLFTGIVEEVGIVQAITKLEQSLQCRIGCTKVLQDVAVGDSIAVNGVCLTVKVFSTTGFVADVMPETVKATTIRMLEVGSIVNLERAMAANGRFGGHFVSGHVDGVGEIIHRRRAENAIYMDIKIEEMFKKYLIDKGSVTVDGTSLTIFEITKMGFVISLIPVTQADSIIGKKQIGDYVNIECDLLAKYMEKLLSPQEQPTSAVTMSMLENNGFLS